VTYRLVFTTFQPEPSIDANMSTFAPPAGVHVVDVRPPSTADVPARWVQLSRQAPFPLFRTTVPAGLSPVIGPGLGSATRLL
jgi:hypothetical protein